MQTTLFLMLTFIKAIIILAGFGFTFWNLIKYFSDKDKPALKKAIKYFFLTFVILFLTMLLEFLIALSLLV